MTEDGEEVNNTWHISQLRRFYARRTQDKIYVTIEAICNQDPWSME
jgi:hypothetical protein